jgi:hypothetical protein
MFAGIMSLHLGFSAGLGCLIRYGRAAVRTHFAWAIGAAYLMFVWLPATYFIITCSWLPGSLRVFAITAGIAIAVLEITRPAWIPQLIWTRAFNRRYLGFAMVLVALSSITPWLPDADPGTLTVGLSACMAGLSAVKGLSTPA